MLQTERLYYSAWPALHQQYILSLSSVYIRSNTERLYTYLSDLLNTVIDLRVWQKTILLIRHLAVSIRKKFLFHGFPPPRMECTQWA